MTSAPTTACRPDSVPYETFAPMHEMKHLNSSSHSVAATAPPVIRYMGHQYTLQNNCWQDSCSLKNNSAFGLAPLLTQQEIDVLKEKIESERYALKIEEGLEVKHHRMRQQAALTAAILLPIIASMVTMVVVGALGLRGVIPMNRHLAKSLIIIPLMPIACFVCVSS